MASPVSPPPSSIIRWSYDQLVQFAKEKYIELPSKAFTVVNFLQTYKLAPKKPCLGLTALSSRALYEEIDMYIDDHLVDAILEEFKSYGMEVDDNTRILLEERYMIDTSFKEMKKNYLSSRKRSFQLIEQSLKKVQRTNTMQNLNERGLYLDGIIHRGSGGVILYDALRNSTPVVCKYFPEKHLSAGEYEWEMSERVHKSVCNSKNIIKFHESITSKLGTYYTMDHFGHWSLETIAFKKFKDNFYSNGKPKFPGALLKRIFCGVLAGLKCLKIVGCSHMDVKLSNIMLAQDGTPTLIDLGSCTKISDKIHSDEGLTLSYAIICKDIAESTEHYDLLCLGVVLYSLSTGQKIENTKQKGGNEEDHRLSFTDDSLCSRLGTLCKTLKNVDDIYYKLVEEGQWDTDVVWPALRSE